MSARRLARIASAREARARVLRAAFPAAPSAEALEVLLRLGVALGVDDDGVLRLSVTSRRVSEEEAGAVLRALFGPRKG